jgi:hypothetical protein
MLHRHQLLESLYAYINFILWCEDRLRQRFQFEGNPWANQKITGQKGSFEIEGNNFEFWFHGAGCTINYRRLELHYDVRISQDNYIEILPWKFMRFVVTYLKLEEEVELTFLVRILSTFVDSGIVIRSDEYDQVFYVNFDWYRNYVIEQA